jgi:hypothetical protein
MAHVFAQFGDCNRFAGVLIIEPRFLQNVIPPIVWSRPSTRTCRNWHQNLFDELFESISFPAFS